MSSMVASTETPAVRQAPGQLRGWLEVLVIGALMPVGAIGGALTGFPPLSSILAVVLPLIAATFFLRSEGMGWRHLMLGTSLSTRQVAMYAALAFGIAWALVFVMTWVLQNLFGFPPVDVSRFEILLKDNPVMYLWYLIPVAWGSAAIGEEMLSRGFLQHRLEGLSNTAVAVVLQAMIFAGVHFYQGLTGVINIFLLALVFGVVYVRCGRNLVPLIIAHGVIDTISLTLIFTGHADLITGT